jgi:muramoyltetrapeptide carboxypeptidase
VTPVKAPALKPGNTVAIAAPASPPNPVYLDSGVRFLKECGFNVRFGRSLWNRHGYLAGSDADRAADFNEMLRNPDIRAVFCARGGYGSARIVRAIDFAALRNDPKLIVGFSDITFLLAALWHECGLIGFHGPLMADRNCSLWSLRYLEKQITGTIDENFIWPMPNKNPRLQYHGTTGYTVKGRLFGGCLSLLSTLAGTPWSIDSDTGILILEDIGEAPYRIDRMLTHLELAGWYRSVKMVLAGYFSKCVQRHDDPEPTPDASTVITEFMISRNIPVISSVPFGHDADNFTIPFGSLIEAGPNGIVQLERGVSR